MFVNLKLEQDLNKLAIASSGLSETKLKQVTAKALAQRGKISKEDIKEILEEKKVCGAIVYGKYASLGLMEGYYLKSNTYQMILMDIE